MKAKYKHIHEYPSQLEIFEGLMGAGKSYIAVTKLVEVLQEQARPVYTNLPLKLPVLRRYLKNRHGDTIANLVNPLSEGHWRRFLRRQSAFDTFRAQYEHVTPESLSPEDQDQLYQVLSNPERHRTYTREHMLTFPSIRTAWLMEWYDTIDPPVTEGPHANHIPPGSLIIIDELQKWHPMHSQAADKDRKHLLSYITMCRHHAHWIWVLTQDAMNVSIEFRRLAHQFWHIWNMREDVIAGPLKFKHLSLPGLPMKAMGYARFTSEQYAAFRSMANAHPFQHCSEKFIIIPALPSHKLIYRLYKSHTHLGSSRHLIRQLKRGQETAGVDPQQLTQEPEPEETTFMQRLFARTMMIVMTIALLALAFFVGNKTANPPPPAALPAIKLIEWPEWSMVSRTPWIGGKPTSVGDKINGTQATLQYVSDDKRALVMLDAQDAYWLWNFGSSPIRVGARADVRTAVANARTADQATADTGPAPTDRD